MISKVFLKKKYQIHAIFLTLSSLLGGSIGLITVQFSKPLYLIFGLLGIIVISGAFASTQLGLLSFIFITYTRFSDIAVHYHGAPSVAKSFVVILLVIILLRWVFFREQPTGWQTPTLILGIYGLVGFSSLLYAKYPELVNPALSDYVKDALICIIVVIMMKSQIFFKRSVWALISAGVFLGTISVFQYITNTFENDYGGFAQAKIMQISGDVSDYRISGSVGDPNFFAQAMLVLVPICLERIMHEKNRWLKVIAIWGGFVSIMAVVLTFSRGGFLSLAVVLIAFIVIYPPRIQSVPYIIFLALVIVNFVPQTFYERIISMEEIFSSISVGFKTNDYSIRGRASQNAAAIEMFKTHPFLGVGWGNSVKLYQEYSQNLGLAPSASDRAIHNLYLEILSQSGIVGLTVFIIIIWQTSKVLILSRKICISMKKLDLAGYITSLGLGFMGYMIASFFVHAAYPRYFYLLIGVIFSLHNVIKDNTLSQVPTDIA